jgi:hypothetical protein
MNIAHFDDLLQLARQQREPQVLLFVFASAGLPADASLTQRAQHESGMGGELTPLMCVDKTPAALTDFDTLCAEADVAGPPWAIVFSAALSGRNGQSPPVNDIDAALRRMVGAIQAGRLEGLLPFDRAGEPVHLT